MNISSHGLADGGCFGSSKRLMQSQDVHSEPTVLISTTILQVREKIANPSSIHSGCYRFISTLAGSQCCTPGRPIVPTFPISTTDDYPSSFTTVLLHLKEMVTRLLQDSSNIMLTHLISLCRSENIYAASKQK